MLNNFHRFQPITLTSFYPTKTINLIKKEKSSSKINVYNKNNKNNNNNHFRSNSINTNKKTISSLNIKKISSNKKKKIILNSKYNTNQNSYNFINDDIIIKQHKKNSNFFNHFITNYETEIKKKFDNLNNKNLPSINNNNYKNNNKFSYSSNNIKQFNFNITKNKTNPNINYNKNNNINKRPQSTQFSFKNKLENQPEKLKKYKIGKIIGKGAYALVKKIIDIQTNEKLAMKIYEKKDFINDINKKKCIQREISILNKVNHKNIVKLKEVIHTSNHILIIMELIEGISMREYYNKNIKKKNNFNHLEKEIKYFFQQIFDCMNYLHKNHIAHRDIKLENILIEKNNNIKIIDFGFGMNNTDFNYRTNNNNINFIKLENFFCGTPNYMPPEIICKKRYVGEKADLWSLGILFYKMVMGDFPFKGKDEKELYKNVKTGKFKLKEGLNENIVKIIKGLIVINPDKRISCSEVLENNWIKY
jgi:tRNA A-37 threonylcarbamoyl transferase component Bud32